MTVRKKMSPDAKSFIDRGADVKSSKDTKSFKNILIRVPTSILTKLDCCMGKKPWLNRTQWIVEAIHEKIKSDIYE